MYCKKCGQELPDAAKFCIRCGTPVQAEAEKQFCSICRTPLEPNALYCPVCGVRVNKREAAEWTQPPKEAAAETTNVNTALSSLNMVSLYQGELVVGIARATGKLTVYSDRLEFKKQFGSSGAMMLGTLGMLAAQKKVSGDKMLIIPLNQIGELRTGKYAGVYNTLVVILKDGTVMSFCPAVPASPAPKEIVDKLKRYM